MHIKIGDKVTHGGETFVIINIKHEEAVEGMGLLIQCVDPEMADHEQQKKMKADQVSQGIMDLIKKTLEKGDGGNFGFHFPQ
jgi:hypothetical protein